MIKNNQLGINNRIDNNANFNTLMPGLSGAVFPKDACLRMRNAAGWSELIRAELHQLFFFLSEARTERHPESEARLNDVWVCIQTLSYTSPG